MSPRFAAALIARSTIPAAYPCFEKSSLSLRTDALRPIAMRLFSAASTRRTSRSVSTDPGTTTPVEAPVPEEVAS